MIRRCPRETTEVPFQQKTNVLPSRFSHASSNSKNSFVYKRSKIILCSIARRFFAGDVKLRCCFE